MAIALPEIEARRCVDALERSSHTLISAVTLAEVLLVSESRDVRSKVEALIDGLVIEVCPADQNTSRRVVEIYRRWGKRNHSANLNFVDCFSYELAASRSCPLLFVGNDFSQTDIRSALA